MIKYTQNNYKEHLIKLNTELLYIYTAEYLLSRHSPSMHQACEALCFRIGKTFLFSEHLFSFLMMLGVK